MTTTFINNGTYGCIFHPSINACNGQITNEEDGEQYITKIQRANEDSHEIEISNIVASIYNCEHFFAPVISSCEVTPNRINSNLIKTCNHIQNDFSQITHTQKYISSKIRYVGKDTIEKTITHRSNSFEKLVNMHLYLLDSIALLQQNKIIHLDIKPDNILFDEIQSVPIIIDFGLSNKTHILENDSISIADNVENLKDIFISDDTYDFWCIDIFIISKIIYEKRFNMSETVTIDNIDFILRYFATNTTRKCFTSIEWIAFEDNYREYFHTVYIAQNKTWIDVFNDLIKNYKTWDNYSLAITCLYLCAKHHPHMRDINIAYIKLLKATLLALPNNRPTQDATKTALLQIFTPSTK